MDIGRHAMRSHECPEHRLDLQVDMTMSRHAERRAQQRCIPPLNAHWPDLYSETEYDGRGGQVRHFSKRSIRVIAQLEGSGPARSLARYFDAFKVVSNESGQTITIGHRTRRVRRR